MDATTIRLQNQISGDARVRCLTGHTNYADLTSFNPSDVTEQFPACLDVNVTSQPSDVMVWKMPSGELYKFQLLSFSIQESPPGSGSFAVSGSFQADFIKGDLRVSVGDPFRSQGLFLGRGQGCNRNSAIGQAPPEPVCARGGHSAFQKTA